MSNLERAFAFADLIQKSDKFESTKFNYLTLECLGKFPDAHNHRWAASFDSGLEEDWYEFYNLAKHPTGSRAPSPEEAIFRAVEKFCILTGFQYERCLHCNPAFMPEGPDDYCYCSCHKKEDNF